MPTGNSHARDDDHAHSHAHTATLAALKDPVCGMTVATESKHQFEYAGRPFYFCSAKCRSKFEAAPEKYLEQDSKAGPSSNESEPS